MKNTKNTAKPTRNAVPTGATVGDLYKAGQRCYDAKDYNSALPYFNEIIKLDPGLSWAHGSVGWSYYMLKDYYTSLESFKTSVRLDPANHLSHAGCGWSYYFLKDYPRAIESFKEAFRLKRDDASYCSARGWCYYFLDDYQRALEVFNEALNVNATCTNAYDGRGCVYHKLGRYPLAMTDFNTSLRLDPYDKIAYHGRGWVYETLNDFVRATADFNEGIKLDSEFHYPYNGRGYVYYRLGEYSKAIEDFKKAIKLDSTHPDVFRNLGLAYLKMREHRLALENIEKAIELKPNYAYAYTARGEYYTTLAANEEGFSAKQTYYQKAKTEYQTALQISLMAVKEKEETEAGLQAVVKALETLSASTSSASMSATSVDLLNLSSFFDDTDPFAGFSKPGTTAIQRTNPFDPFLSSDPFAVPFIQSAPSALSAAFSPTPPPAPMKTNPGLPASFSVIPSTTLTISHKTLGEGSFGIVFKGSWQLIDVAIKQLKMLRLSEEALASFQEEAQCHGALRHPNIVALFGVCVEPGHYSMVMEFMSRGSLYDVLHDKEDILWPVRLSIARHIAIGLSYLHEQRIVHRDLKSLNVLLDDRMQAKLSDFGLSKIKSESQSTTTLSAQTPGTIRWMAPELFKRGAKCTELSDMYALGMVLWELSSRKIPFQDEENATDANVREWVKDGERDTIPSDTPPQYAALITRCWAQRAEDRPDRASAVADSLATRQNEPAVNSIYRQWSRK